jgi:general transcription factor 3C polypeptide 5 (transcription factor C subunit 1)
VAVFEKKNQVAIVFVSLSSLDPMPNYEPSPLLPIGDKKFLSVEYPGVVRRTKRAIKTLGGEKALARSLALNSQVDLWYRPEDTFSHPIHGDVIPTSKLLVKVTRRIKRNKLTGEIETDSKWDIEVVGNVTHAVRFRGKSPFFFAYVKFNFF